MNWTDVFVLVIVGGATAIEIKRGFGPALFTVVGTLVAARLAFLWYTPAAQSLQLTENPGQNQTWMLYAIFALLLAVALTVSHVTHPDTFLSADPFDGPAGGICGFFTGCIVAFVFYSGLRIWGAQDLLQSSVFAPEILHLRTYHTVVRALYNLGEVQSERLKVK